MEPLKPLFYQCIKTPNCSATKDLQVFQREERMNKCALRFCYGATIFVIGVKQAAAWALHIDVP